MRDFGNGAIVLGNAINSDHPLNRGLVSHWLATTANSGGNRLLDLCKRNHGTLTNGASFSGGLGRPGGSQAVKFDGSNDRVSISAIGFNATKMFSFMAYWTSTIDDVILGGSGSSTYYPYCTPTVIQIGGGGATNFTVSLSQNRWYHICIGGDGTTAYCYVDGVSKGSGTDRTPGNMTAIGSYPNGTFVLGGYLNDIRHYNRLLTSSEVALLFHESRRGYPTMLNRLSPLRTFYFGTAAAPPATSRDMSQLHLGSVSFSHRNILQRGRIGVNS